MLVKINNKPIEVKEEPERDGNPIIHITMSVITGFFALYLLDYAAYIFIGYSPFPIIKWIGGLLL